MKNVDNEYLKLMEITPEEKEKRGILARLYGPVATTVSTTRNGRKYSEELWEEVFSKNEIVKELFAKGGIPGECQHPVDRQDIDTEKIAIMMPEMPRKDPKTGLLMGYFDILDTPCGRIAYQLAKYGFKLGVSSRGSGDTYQDVDGTETVEPSTYDFTCFDLVIIPAVADARLNLVEGLDTKNIRLKKALNEALKNASETDRKIMTETLEELHINLADIPEGDANINEGLNNNSEADNDGADIAKELLNALKENKDLVKQVRDLQEKLSVCYTKESEYEESVRDYEERVKSLTESLNEKSQLDGTISELRQQIQIKNAVIEKLNKSITFNTKNRQSLNESISSQDEQIRSLKALNEKLVASGKESVSQITALKESVEELRKDATIKQTTFASKLQKSNALTEKYKKIAQMAVDKYIACQANLLNVSMQDIKSRLNENYSFDDIDRVCESLKTYHFDADSLPFDTISRGAKVRLSVTESREPIKEVVNGGTTSIDDDCDEQLLSLARL